MPHAKEWKSVEELPPDELKLFRAFQSNLLSLISHELRTPLMGILNAVGLLDDDVAGATSGIPQRELVKMARQNAERLQRTLTTLLDMASLESQTFHARLLETELSRMVKNRIEQHRSIFRDNDIAVSFEGVETIALADPQKFSRALDLCFEVLGFRARKGSELKVRISSADTTRMRFDFEIESGTEESWKEAWKHGMESRDTAFAGVLQSEEAFLSRAEEGLGSEFQLVHEIMRLHQGEFTHTIEGTHVTLTLALPGLTSEKALSAVLTSRAYAVSNHTASVALVLIKLPKGRKMDQFRADLKSLLYRTTDGVYALPDRNAIAIVMDDYKRADVARFMSRLETSLDAKLDHSSAHCPEDVADPARLFETLSRSDFS